MYILDIKPWDCKFPVSKNFVLGEFVSSYNACRKNVVEQFVFREDIFANIQFLAETLLQPLRDAVGQPITITSGYRCRMTNILCGGAQNSLHLLGLAADIQCRSQHNKIVELMQDMTFHELIIYENRLHVSVKEAFNEKRIIRKAERL